MNFCRSTARIYIPDGCLPSEAIPAVTHLGIGAHPDDIEFMCWHGILRCLHRKDRKFASIVMTTGSGSSRTGEFANFTDEEMVAERAREQQKAAVLGEYAASFNLGYSSAELREPGNGELTDPAKDLRTLLLAMRPEVIYTHNLADRHDSHVACALRVIEALRDISSEYKPVRFYGCEVWRSLDWLTGASRVAFDVSAHPNMIAALLGVYDSQIAGGKRYDLASMGRRAANATYADAYAPDEALSLELAMDMMPLLQEPEMSPQEYAQAQIKVFADDVKARLAKLQGCKQ